MTEEHKVTMVAIHRRVDQIADHGDGALGNLAELLYYADEEDTLPFLRLFVFLSAAEKQVLFTLVDRMSRIRKLAEKASSSGAP